MTNRDDNNVRLCNLKTPFIRKANMEKIEYPIKKLVSLRMDENKVWCLDYNTEHECFPQISKKWGNGIISNKKGYKDLLYQLYHYFLGQNFLLEGSGKMIKQFGRKPLGWTDHYVLANNDLPQYLIPCRMGKREFCFPHMIQRNGGFSSNPYYGNEKYKKYVEDNNGECPLPLPDSVFTHPSEYKE